MPGRVRRIVTGLNAAGKSVVVADSLVPPDEPAPGQRLRAGLWITDTAPASNATPDPVPDGVIAGIAPPPCGTVFRIVDIPPDGTHTGSAADLGSRGAHLSQERTARHPGFHKTDTVDYAICLEGEIWAVLDEGETLMKAGDVLIQRGTWHAWSNRTDQPCRMAFILIDADAVG
ncbi:MAG: cupin domain-containing protein [Chloroflexi bacterium]|nr:cupin domain-containing protein [Chloroflexota bacterium]